MPEEDTLAHIIQAMRDDELKAIVERISEGDEHSEIEENVLKEIALRGLQS